MKNNDSDSPKLSSRTRIYLRALGAVLLTANLLLTLNFSSLELLPPGNTFSYNYGWPLSFYKKGLQLEASFELQLLSVCGDIIINGLVLFGVWFGTVKLTELRLDLLEGDSKAEETKPLQFHLLTLLITAAVVAFFIYLNTIPRKYDFEQDQNVNYGWPSLIFTLSFDPKRPPHVSFVSVYINLILAGLATYATALLSEKIIALRSRKNH